MSVTVEHWTMAELPRKRNARLTLARVIPVRIKGTCEYSIDRILEHPKDRITIDSIHDCMVQQGIPTWLARPNPPRHRSKSTISLKQSGSRSSKL